MLIHVFQPFKWKWRLTQRTSTGTWKKPVRIHAVFRGCCLLLVMVGAAAAADWPTFRHDNHRSGQTLDQLPAARLAANWVYRSPCPPQPAWAGPAKWDAYKNLTLRSMRNYAPVYHVTVCGSSLYFGSSVDDVLQVSYAGPGIARQAIPADVLFRKKQ